MAERNPSSGGSANSLRDPRNTHNEDGTRYQITSFAEDFNFRESLLPPSSSIQRKPSLRAQFSKKKKKRDAPTINGDGPVALKLKNGNKEYELIEFTNEVPSSNVASVAPQDLFVTPRGGEYFFIPSISTMIDAWAKAT